MGLGVGLGVESADEQAGLVVLPAELLVVDRLVVPVVQGCLVVPAGLAGQVGLVAPPP